MIKITTIFDGRYLAVTGRTGTLATLTLKEAEEVHKALGEYLKTSGPFKWKQESGGEVGPVDMATPHLFHAYRLLWNNTVPTMLRVGIYSLRPHIQDWPEKYKKQAFEELGKELSQRVGLLTHEQQIQREQIAFNTRFL